MPLYVADYLGDTQHLTVEQHGAYMLLLMAMWRSGGRLPADAQKIARIVRMTPARWLKISDDIMAFFEVDGGEITQKRLAAEIEKASEKHQRRVSAGSKGGIAKSLKNKDEPHSNAKAMLCHSSEPESEEEKREGDKSPSCPKPRKARVSYPADFEEFWKGFPTDANMSKAEAFKAWKPMLDDDKALVLASLPAFRRYCLDRPDYRPVHACRYLSQRRFEGHAAAKNGATPHRGRTESNLGSPETWDDDRWRMVLRLAREDRVWDAAFGPPPGDRDCKIPKHLITDRDRNLRVAA